MAFELEPTLLSRLFLRSPDYFVLSCLLTLVSFAVLRYIPGNSPRLLSPGRGPIQAHDQWPVLGAIGFFISRQDFFFTSVKQSITGSFSFFVGNVPVVGLSGDAGRRLFFETKELSLEEGQTLSPQILSPPQTSKDGKGIFAAASFASYFRRRLGRILSRDNARRVIPIMIEDMTDTFGKPDTITPGVIDPFVVIYRLIFQMTMRNLGCDDVADNPALLNRGLHLFRTVDVCNAPYMILFPWFFRLFTLAFWRQIIAGSRLYILFKNVINGRIKSGKQGTDAVQFMLDQGDDKNHIIGFMIAGLFGGILNSAIIDAWVLVHLAANPEWMTKARIQIKAIAAKHGRLNEMLLETLSNLTLEIWETEFSVLELCLKETMRLHLQGVFARLNVGGADINIDGKESIPRESFAVYHIADIHMNPQLYPEPETWDPSRFDPENDQSLGKVHGFVGWGVGRHPCLGVRLAKLESYLATAFFLAMYDFELSDRRGNPVSELPPMNPNWQNACRPTKPVYFKITPRDGVPVSKG